MFRVLNCRRLWADFLGLTKEINGVENTAVDLRVATQKGLCIVNSVMFPSLV